MVTFIGGYWWLWLLVMVVAGGYALYNQIQRIKGMSKGFSAITTSVGIDAAFNQSFNSFFKGIAPLIVAGGLSSIAGLLFIISVIINIVQMAS